MAGGVPKTIANEVTESRRAIEDAMHSTYVVNDIASERLRRRILTLLASQSTPSRYRSILHHEAAYISAIQGKFHDAMDQLKASANWGLNELAIAFTAAHVAILSGRMLSAREILDSSLFDGEIPAESRSLVAAIQVSIGSMEKAVKLTGPDKPEYTHVNAAARIMESIGVADIELTNRLDTACRVIRDAIQHPILGYKIFAMEGEGILYRFVVKARVDDLIELNDKVLDALMESHDGPLDQHLSICVTPWSGSDTFNREEAYSVSIPG